MIFDVLKFLRDYHIPHTMEGARARRGWVQTQCPFCGGGERGWDLGICLGDNRVSCWRCRGKHIVQTIRALARCTREESERIHKQYLTRHLAYDVPDRPQADPKKAVVLPAGCAPLRDLPRHQKYLVDRNFDPLLLERIYGLQGTGPIGDYKFRVVAPIMFEGRLVSYQCRDITGKVEKDKRYKACAMKDEAIHHKHVMYGMDLAIGDSCAVVEGITDEWRLGPGSIATFGTGFTPEQARLIAQRFSRVFMIFDPEPQAQAVAEELGWYLSSLGREVIFPDGLECDPGDLSQDDGDALMRMMGLRGHN